MPTAQERPNGLPLSCRERTPECVFKNQRSRARSGRLQRRVRRPGRRRSIADRMCRPHHPGTTPAQRAFGRNHAPLGSRPAQRASIWYHAQHTITLPITGMQHNGRSYHTSTTCFGMPRDPHNARSESEIRLFFPKGMAHTLPRVPNGMPLSRRKRWYCLPKHQ